MKIDLPWPAKVLWPNGRTLNHRYKALEIKKHRAWAKIATLEALQNEGTGGLGQYPIPVAIHVHAKPRGPLPDRDGCVSACKAMLDGIADALGVNDRDFAAPLVEFAPVRDGRIVIELGHRVGHNSGRAGNELPPPEKEAA